MNIPARVWVLVLISGSAAAVVLGGLVSTHAYWGAAAAAGLALLAVLAAFRIISARLWDLRNAIAAIPRETTLTAVSELHAMHVMLRRFPELSLPTTSWSIRFSNLLAIVDVLDRLRPRLVVELGSGISTLCIAAWMKRAGEGRVLSLDHDRHWADLTRQYIFREGLDGHATVVFAPLVEHEVWGRQAIWYCPDSIPPDLDAVELLIVDGPCAGPPLEDPLVRWPALPVFHARLAPHAVVFLDDARRTGEQVVAHRWRQEYPDFRFSQIISLTGAAIFERCPTEFAPSPPDDATLSAATLAAAPTARTGALSD